MANQWMPVTKGCKMPEYMDVVLITNTFRQVLEAQYTGDGCIFSISSGDEYKAIAWQPMIAAYDPAAAK